MRYKILIIASIIICSCSGKNDVPNGILDKEQMANVLIDIYDAEYKAQHVGVNYDSSKVLFRHYELKILEEHGINDSVYRKSFAYYLDNPIEFESVYDIVIDSLSLQEQVDEARAKNKNTK